MFFFKFIAQKSGLKRSNVSAFGTHVAISKKPEKQEKPDKSGKAEKVEGGQERKPKRQKVDHASELPATLEVDMGPFVEVKGKEAESSKWTEKDLVYSKKGEGLTAKQLEINLAICREQGLSKAGGVYTLKSAQSVSKQRLPSNASTHFSGKIDKFHFDESTKQGGRSNQEDASGVVFLDTKFGKVTLPMVSDGHGGDHVAKYAVKMFPIYLEEFLNQAYYQSLGNKDSDRDVLITAAISEALHKTNEECFKAKKEARIFPTFDSKLSQQEINEKNKKQWFMGGATFVASVVMYEGDQAVMYNVSAGDSAIVLVKPGSKEGEFTGELVSFIQAVTDGSNEKARLDALGAKLTKRNDHYVIHPDNSNGWTAVPSCLGDEWVTKDKQRLVVLRPVISKTYIDPDVVAYFVCDGVIEHLNVHQIAYLHGKNQTPSEIASAALKGLGNGNPSTDNVTVLKFSYIKKDTFSQETFSLSPSTLSFSDPI